MVMISGKVCSTRPLLREAVGETIGDVTRT